MHRAHELLEAHKGSAKKALFAACESGDSDVAVCLVKEFGVDIETSEFMNDGETPLYSAASYGHHEVIRALAKECGAKVDSKSIFGNTPLHIAAQNGHLWRFVF